MELGHCYLPKFIEAQGAVDDERPRNRGLPPIAGGRRRPVSRPVDLDQAGEFGFVVPEMRNLWSRSARSLEDGQTFRYTCPWNATSRCLTRRFPFCMERCRFIWSYTCLQQENSKNRANCAERSFRRNLLHVCQRSSARERKEASRIPLRFPFDKPDTCRFSARL